MSDSRVSQLPVATVTDPGDYMIINKGNTKTSKISIEDLLTDLGVVAGNGALTIKTAGQGANATGTFTANQSAGSTITLPTIRYGDLSGRPSIGNGTITIKQPGTSDQTFTVNQSGNTEINLKNDNTNTTYTANNGVLLTGTNFTADNTVVRTTGNQNIGGAKRFTQSVDCFNTIITGFGDTAAGIAIGAEAYAKRTTATQNVAIGYQTLGENLTGNNNTAVGVQSLQFGTAPRNCVAVGQHALSQSNQQNCVAVGRSAAQLSNAIATTAIGASALNAVTTGNNNTCIGFSSAVALTSGSNNVSIGIDSMSTASISERNVAIGPQSLKNLTEGGKNVAIGDRAGITLTTGNNNICIGKEGNGYTAVFEGTTESNFINMGNRNVTDAYVRVAWTVVSDERDKTNFKTVPHGLDFVNKLKPISYQFKVNRTSDKSIGPIRYGFKAQDILELEGDNPVVIDNKDEDLFKYKGEHLVPILVNAIQELSQELDELKKSLPVK